MTPYEIGIYIRGLVRNRSGTVKNFSKRYAELGFESRSIFTHYINALARGNLYGSSSSLARTPRNVDRLVKLLEELNVGPEEKIVHAIAQHMAGFVYERPQNLSYRIRRLSPHDQDRIERLVDRLLAQRCNRRK
jgi:hypothetical protein